MNGENALAWNGNWSWSLPLIVVTVIFHVIGLGYIDAKILDKLGTRDRRHFVFAFALVMGVTTLAATVLHGFEAAIWAVAYLLLGALPDGRGATRTHWAR